LIAANLNKKLPDSMGDFDKDVNPLRWQNVNHRVKYHACGGGISIWIWLESRPRTIFLHLQEADFLIELRICNPNAFTIAPPCLALAAPQPSDHSADRDGSSFWWVLQ